MIRILDDRTQKFVDFLNTNYGANEVVRLSVLNGYDSVSSDESGTNGFAVYIPPMRTILIPTEIPKNIKETEDEELIKNFIIHNLAHEYAHFLQDIGKLEGFDNEKIIEKVADEFAEKVVAEFIKEENA